MFNSNLFSLPFNFLSVIYNAQITLKETEISQIYLEKKTEELKFSYKSKKYKRKRRRNKWSIEASK